ncbi:hypothetical protein EUX98_g5343 [Antrodiella citrinella]|uniref:Uncharacterized protein n=1 Tax=Antrodiella citrinella TaxID=2447956 RepID=A0A4S4MRT1_9APHY|nr:hypothetical protein EUX98_g5343 [Antrodiella citrinella]
MDEPNASAFLSRPNIEPEAEPIHEEADSDINLEDDKPDFPWHKLRATTIISVVRDLGLKYHAKSVAQNITILRVVENDGLEVAELVRGTCKPRGRRSRSRGRASSRAGDEADDNYSGRSKYNETDVEEGDEEEEQFIDSLVSIEQQSSSPVKSPTKQQPLPEEPGDLSLSIGEMTRQEDEEPELDPGKPSSSARKALRQEEEESEPEPNPEPPRPRRGRPPGLRNKSQSRPPGVPVGEIPAVRRKPGRPRKQPLPDDVTSIATSVAATPVSSTPRRGRPPKKRDVDEDDNAPRPPSRPRGRPPKARPLSLGGVGEVPPPHIEKIGPPKRQPGRPRKREQQPGFEKVGPPKRGPRRPRRIRDEELEPEAGPSAGGAGNVAEFKTGPPKRGSGRPRKVREEEPVAGPSPSIRGDEEDMNMDVIVETVETVDEVGPVQDPPPPSREPGGVTHSPRKAQPTLERPAAEVAAAQEQAPSPKKRGRPPGQRALAPPVEAPVPVSPLKHGPLVKRKPSGQEAAAGPSKQTNEDRPLSPLVVEEGPSTSDHPDMSPRTPPKRGRPPGKRARTSDVAAIDKTGTNVFGGAERPAKRGKPSKSPKYVDANFVVDDSDTESPSRKNMTTTLPVAPPSPVKTGPPKKRGRPPGTRPPPAPAPIPALSLPRASKFKPSASRPVTGQMRGKGKGKSMERVASSVEPDPQPPLSPSPSPEGVKSQLVPIPMEVDAIMSAEESTVVGGGSSAGGAGSSQDPAPVPAARRTDPFAFDFAVSPRSGSGGGDPFTVGRTPKFVKDVCGEAVYGSVDVIWPGCRLRLL